VNYYSAVVQRHLEANHRAMSLPRIATEQMSPSLDDLSIRFAAFTRNAKGCALDLGCGDGIASAAALVRGGRVLAVDPDQDALHQLLARVPPERYRRLKVQVGRLPELDFKFSRFSAVHAARLLHLLDPFAFRLSLRKFFRWLYPSGTLFISTLASGGHYWAFAEREIFRRKMAQDPWPGYIADVRRLRPAWPGECTSVHLIDEPILRRELQLAGFEIEHLSSYALPWDPDQMCSAVVARCGP
jgi:SAM-dependent methyltransferase